MTDEFRCEECNRSFGGSEALAMHNSAKHGVSKPGSVPKNKLSKKTMAIVAIAVIIIAGYWFLSAGKVSGNAVIDNGVARGSSIDNKDSSSQTTNEVQKITLSMRGNYYPNTIKVKSGVPVEITLDGSIRGCYRAFIIPDLGVSKRSYSPSDTIDFIPSQKGTFRFQCGMGMGTGTLIVE